MEFIFKPYGDLIFREKLADIDMRVCLFCPLLPHREMGSEKGSKKKKKSRYLLTNFDKVLSRGWL